MPLTPHQINEAWRLRANHVSWKNIGKLFGVGAETVQKSLYPERKQRQRFRLGRFGQTYRVGPLFIPPEIIAERDRLIDHQPTIYETIFGDPPFFRSALAKKQGY